MKDTLIKYETAKLAKEKGFDELCDLFYAKDKVTLETDIYGTDQSLLQKWLREKHGICVYNDYKNMNLVICSLYKDNKIHVFDKWSIVSRDDIKELEKGLLEALKLIKS